MIAELRLTRSMQVNTWRVGRLSSIAWHNPQISATHQPNNKSILYPNRYDIVEVFLPKVQVGAADPKDI